MKDMLQWIVVAALVLWIASSIPWPWGALFVAAWGLNLGERK